MRTMLPSPSDLAHREDRHESMPGRDDHAQADTCRVAQSHIARWWARIFPDPPENLSMMSGGYIAAGILVVVLDMFLWTEHPVEYLLETPQLALLGVLLAFSSRYVPFFEITYIALLASFLLFPWGESIGMPIVGAYFIVVNWIRRLWYKPAVVACIVIEGVQIFDAIRYDSLLFQLVATIFSLLCTWFVGITLRNQDRRIAYLKQQADSERKKAVEATFKVRRDLAAELHDTTAKDLARIAIISQKLIAQHPGAADDLAELSRIATVASQRLRPVILNLDVYEERASISSSISQALMMLSTRDIDIDIDLNDSFTIDTVDSRLTRQQRLIGALVIRESASNILKYAPEGSQASISLDIDQSGLSITTSNTVKNCISNPHISGGFGLTNLHQRVRDEGGEMSFGRTGSRWILFAIIPKKGE
ncbi:hypothetical protein I6E29_04275 [Arcanobacterium haemolyticum]|nr:hypothetical protein [Arcanobacterium haemolyticum]